MPNSKKKNMGTRLTNTYNKIGMTMLNFIPKNWVQNKLGKFKHDSLWINTMSSQKMEFSVVIFTSTLCCSSHQFIVLVYVLDRKKKKVFMVSLSHYPTHTMTLYKEKKLLSYFHPISNRIIWLLDWENHRNLDQIFQVTLKCRRDHIGD